jgi:hypothetical protein
MGGANMHLQSRFLRKEVVAHRTFILREMRVLMIDNQTLL